MEFPPYVDGLEDRLAAVDKDMVEAPNDEHLAELTAIRVRADFLRRTLTPGREVLSRPTIPVTLPGDTSDAGLYASDIADELASITGDLDSISERCTTSVGLIASLASNRQAVASRQLAAVATVFLPVTFVVGFFGMNFDVLINNFEQGWPAFILLGVLLNVACVMVTVWLLGRRGWR